MAKNFFSPLFIKDAPWRIGHLYSSLKLLEKIKEWLKKSDTHNDEITGMKSEPFTAKPTTVRRREPEIVYKHIADTEKEWVNFCLVQLDFSIIAKPFYEEFGYILRDDERGKVKNKVFEALNVARKNGVDLICFPELSFLKEWVEEIRISNDYRNMIIIGGSYYDAGYNVCPIIINGRCVLYKKCYPSPLENPELTGRGMKSGNILYIFQTKCGMFSVLTCIDYIYQSYRICKDYNVNFIINPCYNPNTSRFQQRCNSDCLDHGIDVIQVNKANEGEKYGKSCIIGREHRVFLEKLKNDGFKPQDDIKYKLFQLNGEMMAVVELGVGIRPPADWHTWYCGRIKVRREKIYKYVDGGWVPLS